MRRCGWVMMCVIENVLEGVEGCITFLLAAL